MAMGWIAVPQYVKNKRTPNQIFEDKLLKKFEEEHRRQELRRQKDDRRKQLEDLRTRQDHRRIIYEAFQKRYLQSRMEEQYAIAIHNCLRGNWHEMEQLDHSMEISITHKHTMRYMKAQEDLIQRAIKDFEEFEGRGYPLGVDTPPDSTVRDPKDKKDRTLSPGKKEKSTEKSTKDSKKGDTKSKKGQDEDVPILDPIKLAQDGKAYLDDVKRRKAEEEVENFEADLRRRKERVVRLLQEKEEAAAKKKEEKDDFQRNFSEDALRRQELEKMEKEEKISWVAQRILLEQQIAEQRDKEWDLVLARDHEMLMMIREDFWEETQKECKLREEEKRLKKEKERADGKVFCFEVLLQILSLAENGITYKESTQCDVPTTEWNDWKTLFLKNAVLPSPLQPLNLTSTEDATKEVEIIADKFVLEYIDEDGEWEGLNIGKNAHLGRILGCIHDIADTPKIQAPNPLPDLSELKVKLALLGSPYTGKSTLAKQLADEFGLICIEIDKVVGLATEAGMTEKATLEMEIDEAVSKELDQKHVKDPDQKDPQTQQEPHVDSKLSPEARLGLLAKAALDGGQKVPDEVLVKLLVLTFSSLDDYVSSAALLAQRKQARESGETKPKGKPQAKGKPAVKGGKGSPPGSKPTTAQANKKGTPSSGKGQKNEIVERQGFILDGFPSTLEQAEILERNLTGLDLRFSAHHAAHASVIAPPPPVPVEKVVSGLDGLLCLPSITAEAAIKRSLGKCFDPKTGRAYHLLFDPPPKDDKTGIVSRLQTVEEAPVVQARVTEGANVWTAITEWLKRFANAFWIKHEEFPVAVRDSPEKQSGKGSKDKKGTAQAKVGASLKQSKAEDKSPDKKGETHKSAEKPGSPKTGAKSGGKAGSPEGVQDAKPPPQPTPTEADKAIQVQEALKSLAAGNCEYAGEASSIVPAAETSPVVTEAHDPSRLVQSLIDAKRQARVAAAAAEAAQQADEAAAKALAEAEKASELTTNVVQQLLFVKVAEVKAAAVIEKTGPDPTAQKIVKAEASQLLGKKLSEVSKALQDTEAAAQLAQKAAEQALKAAEAAHDGAALAAAALTAKAQADASSEAAKQAALRASQSGQKAAVAAEAATAVVDKVKQDIDRLDNPDAPEIGVAVPATGKKGDLSKKADAAPSKKADGSPDGDKKEPKSKDGKKSGAKGKGKDADKKEKSSKAKGGDVVEPTAEPANPVIQQPPFMEKGLAELFHAQWVSIEDRYIQSLKDVFSKLRRGRPITRYKMKEVKLSFVDYLKRPDDKQKTIEEYQGRYNRIDFKQRSEKKIIPKLQVEADKLKQKLQSVCDTHLQEAQKWRDTSFADWLDKRTAAIVSLFTFFIQAEFDRYLETCSHLQEFQLKQLGATTLETFRTDLTTVPEKASEKKGAAKGAASAPKKQPAKGKLDERAPAPKQLPATTHPLPGWLEALWYTVPEIYQVVVRALGVSENIMKALGAYYSDLTSAKSAKDTTEKAVPDRKANKEHVKGMDKKVGGKGKEPPHPKVNDGPNELSDTVVREHEILTGRLKLIVRKACVYIGELQPMIESTGTLMNKWMMDRYNAESQAVAEVVELAERAVAEGIPLWYKLNLDGETFTVDENQLMLTPPTPLGLDPAPDLTVWHFEILEHCVEDFRTLAPKGVVPVSQAQSILSNCVEVVHNSVKDDLKQTVIPRLPGTKRRPAGPFQVWIDNFASNVKASLYDPEAGENACLDWRALLITLADTRYNKCISGATLEDIGRARQAIEGGRKIKFCLSSQGFQKITLWLDSEEKGGSAKIGAHLKKVVHRMLDDGKPGVPWQRLLLFLCRDADRKTALLKAFSVLASLGAGTGPVEVTPEMLLEAVYPFGVEASAAAGCTPWTPADLMALLADIRKEKSQVVPIRVAEASGFKGSAEATQGSDASRQTPPMTDTKYIREGDDFFRPFEFHSRASDISNFSDHTNFTVREFLAACRLGSSRDSVADSDTRISEFSDETAFTVQECLTACYRGWKPAKPSEDESSAPSEKGTVTPKEPPIVVYDLFDTAAATVVKEALVSNYGKTCVPGYLYQMGLKDTVHDASTLLAPEPGPNASRPPSPQYSEFSDF